MDLSELRQGLNDYVENYPREFRGVLPPINLEELSVVAFVQDDSDKSVLQAVTVKVPESD